jgi:Flp pilus assembly protein TadB
VIAVVVPRLLKSITHAKDIATRTALIRQAPEVADMLSATLAAGTPLTTAVQTIGRSMSDPAGAVFREIARGTDLGADPDQAWIPASTQDALAPIAHAVLRATLSGASLSDVLLGVADDARRRHQSLVEVAARTAGVKAVAPLAACFLPAFILLGVVPTVVALAGQLF